MKEILRINLRRLFQEIPLCRSDVMKPIAAPMVGEVITSSIHVLILVPVFFVADEGTASPAWYVTAGAGGVNGGKGSDDSATSSRTDSGTVRSGEQRTCRNSKFIR